MLVPPLALCSGNNARVRVDIVQRERAKYPIVALPTYSAQRYTVCVLFARDTTHKPPRSPISQSRAVVGQHGLDFGAKFRLRVDTEA